MRGDADYQSLGWVKIPPDDVTYSAQQAPVESMVNYGDWYGATIRVVNQSWVNNDQYAMQGEQVVDNGTVTSD